MFGFGRRRVTDHVVSAIRPLIANYQHVHGMPAGFWTNDFVISFIGFLVSFHTSCTSGKKLSAEDKGYVLFEAFTNLSNMNGLEIGRRYTSLATAIPKNVEFERGADNAAICAFYSIGKLTADADEWVEKAERIAATQSNGKKHAAVLAALFHMLFYQQLHEIFGETDEGRT